MAKRRNSESDSSESATKAQADDSSSSSDGEDEEWGRKANSKSKKKKSGLKKIKSEVLKADEEREEGEVDDDDDEDDLDDEMDEFNDGFDENLFGDEEDQKRLNQMTEKEREQELFNRSEKREVLKTRFEIERKLRQQKRSEKERLNRKAFSESSLRSNERRRDLEVKNPRKDALKGLKEMREKKKQRQQKLRASDVYSSSSDSDEDDDGAGGGSGRKSSSSSSSSSDDSDNDTGRRRRNRDDDRNDSDDDVKDDYVVSLTDLNDIRVSRSMVEKWVHAPFFASTLAGAFTKVGIGQKSAGSSAGLPVYRICQIVDVVEGASAYELANTRTNKQLLLRFGKDEKKFRLEYVSNGDFVANEFTQWKEKLESDGIDLPDRKLIENKRRDLQVATNYRFTDQDIESILKEKEKFNKTPKNFAMKKTQLMKQKEMAEQACEEAEVLRLQQELDELEEKAKELDKARTHSIAAISYINERNRLRNISEAEKAIVQETKEREMNACDDPFRRRQCAPQLVAFKSGKKNPLVKTEPDVGLVKSEPGTESPAPTVQAVPAATATTSVFKKEVKSERPASPDSDPSDLFSAHDFEIQINFDLNSSLPQSHSTAGSAYHISTSNGTESDSKKPLTNRRSINLEEYKRKMHLI